MREASAVHAFQRASLSLSSPGSGLLWDKGGGEDAAEEEGGEQGVNEGLLPTQVCCYGYLTPVDSREEETECRDEDSDNNKMM